jgi:hypothetical protein
MTNSRDRLCTNKFRQRALDAQYGNSGPGGPSLIWPNHAIAVLWTLWSFLVVVALVVGSHRVVVFSSTAKAVHTCEGSRGVTLVAANDSSPQSILLLSDKANIIMLKNGGVMPSECHVQQRGTVATDAALLECSCSLGRIFTGKSQGAVLEAQTSVIRLLRSAWRWAGS